MKVKLTQIDTQKVGLDLGNAMMKAVRYNHLGEIVRVTLPNKLQTEDTHNTEDCRCIVFNGKKMYVGIGDLNDNHSKHTRPHLLEQALVMIAELYPEAYDVKVSQLRLGLPAEHSLNKMYVDELKSHFPTNKWLEFQIIKEDEVIKRRVFIESVGVCVEGYSAYIAIKNNLEIDEDILVCDVGGGTTDLVNFSYNGGKFKVGNVLTIPTGAITLTDIIADNINKKLGSDFQGSKIDERLMSGKNTVHYKTTHNIMDYADVIEPNIETMIKRITKKYGDINKYFVIGIGGGYATFNSIANKYISSSIELDEETRFYANAEGFLKQ